MADRKGGNIIDTSVINTLTKQGEKSQKACQAAIEKYCKKEKDAKKIEEMKKLSEDTRTSSQTACSKGI
jgi:hypothetical protein